MGQCSSPVPGSYDPTLDDLAYRSAVTGSTARKLWMMCMEDEWCTGIRGAAAGCYHVQKYNFNLPADR
jgi:hypothetical protein